MFCPPQFAAALVADIPRGQGIKVDGVGHNVHTERAEWLTETVTEWVRP